MISLNNDDSRRYERNACFHLWIYKQGVSQPQLEIKPISQGLDLPISKKHYKVTLKNIKTYLTELLETDSTIEKIEIERASHVGSFKRKESINE